MTNRSAVFAPGSVALTVIGTVLVLAGVGAAVMSSRPVKHASTHSISQLASPMEACISAACTAANRMTAASYQQTAGGRFTQLGNAVLHRPVLERSDDQAPTFVAQSR